MLFWIIWLKWPYLASMLFQFILIRSDGNKDLLCRFDYRTLVALSEHVGCQEHWKLGKSLFPSLLHFAWEVDQRLQWRVAWGNQKPSKSPLPNSYPAAKGQEWKWLVVSFQWLQSHMTGSIFIPSPVATKSKCQLPWADSLCCLLVFTLRAGEWNPCHSQAFHGQADLKHT